jgi:excinuclease UvrABC nuclease subunit
MEYMKICDEQKGEIALKRVPPRVPVIYRTIRDEAHRFAVAYHRLLRRKKVVEEG